MKGYIYLYGGTFRGEGIYKIGYSIDPERRIKKIVKMPFPCELIYICKTENALSLERELHNHWDNRRLHGEWFSLRECDLREFPLVAISLGASSIVACRDKQRVKKERSSPKKRVKAKQKRGIHGNRKMTFEQVDKARERAQEFYKAVGHIPHDFLQETAKGYGVSPNVLMAAIKGRTYKETMTVAFDKWLKKCCRCGELTIETRTAHEGGLSCPPCVRKQTEQARQRRLKRQ